MFYVNNKQVLGIFLNGNNYNYMAFGFDKIIPENRNAQFAYINLAQRYLSQYRVEYGNIQSGYDNFPVARLDYPVNGIFHSPLTYYYGGNIVPTKNVPVYINNGYYALNSALVYNDINVSGNIVHFAANTDFQGHNVNIHPENFRSSQPYFNGAVMSDCTNFTLHSGSRLSKNYQVALYGCNKFIGWFNFFGDDDGTRFPGFRGFLHTCRDGVFNFNLINMHGGGSDSSVTNYYNFSCITNCDNIGLTIKGSPWQAWVHPKCYSSNCNINTWYIVPGFDSMRDCNFKFYIPRHADVEKSAYYSILSNSSNCNVYFDGTNSNLYSFRNGDMSLFLFEDLNNCNLNLLLDNSAGLDYSFGNRLNNCNIQFDNLDVEIDQYGWLNRISNCNVYGSVIKSNIMGTGLITDSTDVNLNVNASSANMFWPLWNSSNITGNIIMGNLTWMNHINNLILNLYNGNTLEVENLSNVKLKLDNVNNVTIFGAYNSNFKLNGARAKFTNINNIYARADNTSFRFYNTNNTNIYSEGGNTSILGADNCYNLTLSGLTFNTTDSDSLFENIYNSKLKFGITNPYYRLWRVNNCDIDGFPRSFAYVKKCVFRPFTMSNVAITSSGVGTWYNVWPHNRVAGIRSMDNMSRCRVEAGQWVNNGDINSGGNNLQTDLGSYYNDVTVHTDNENSRLNVSCNLLRLDLMQIQIPGLMPIVDAGFVDSSISANNIVPFGGFGTTNGCAKVGTNTRVYCSNYCETPFYSTKISYSSQNQPVVLLNNYKITNSQARMLVGGLYRFGTLLNTSYLIMNNGACVFINNTRLTNVNVDNALLFMGSNARVTGTINVTNGGLIVNSSNWGPGAHYFLTTKSFAWNVWDSGPWGSQSLLDYCKNV